MGRAIKSIRCGQMSKLLQSGLADSSHQISGAKVFWSDAGDLLIVTDEDWSRYLMGHDDQKPWERVEPIHLDDADIALLFSST